MKKLCAILVCCCVWQVPGRAVELALGETAPMLVDTAASQEDNGGTTRLDLAGREGAVGVRLDGLLTPVSTENMVSSVGWTRGRAAQALALGSHPAASVLGTLSTASLLDEPAAAGLPEGIVYTVLSLLAAALAWACSGWINRPVSAAAPETLGAPRSRRNGRVRMVPLNVSR